MDVTKETVKELIAVGQKSIGVLSANEIGIKFAVVPNDSRVVSLEEYQHTDYAEAPHRKKAMVVLREPKSFIEYWNLFHDEDSRLFADDQALTVRAILDYHRSGEKPPRWGQHQATLYIQPSDEWSTWINANGKRTEQIAFAEFIEDNTPDIFQPDAATMLEVARSLHAKSGVEFSSGVRLSNGQVKLSYNENIKGTFGTGDVEVPETFIIRIPVFLGTPKIDITARLRYRLNSGKLVFWYDLLRPNSAARDGFKKVIGQIEEATKTDVLVGSPE